jgi:hypothetical protein
MQHITWHVMWGYECKMCLGVTWENMDEANGQTQGKTCMGVTWENMDRANGQTRATRPL